LQRRKELGVRLALGARAFDIAKHVTRDMSLMVAVGVVAGIVLGFATARFIVLLLYNVKVTDPTMLAIPLLVIAGTSLAAALPAVVRAASIDAASMLRAE
jgi:ABC-type antimicrobial peptide transport system permease subunit